MNQSINTDSKNSKEPQQKYRLGTVSIKILGGLNHTVSKRYQGTGILKSDCKQPLRIGIIRALNECTGRLKIAVNLLLCHMAHINVYGHLASHAKWHKRIFAPKELQRWTLGPCLLLPILSFKKHNFG